jgi:ABC-type transport system substrate-binding protein
MRRLIVGILVLALGTLGLATGSLGQKVPAPRGELRVVDKDWSNWVWITMNVFEHLIESDKDGKLVPRLATGWRWRDDRTLEVKLRPGVRFHNGEVFDAAIVRLNWDENFKLKQPHVDAWMTFKPGSRLEIVDRQTVRFVFSEPDGAALAKLSFMHIGNRQFYRELGWGEQHW